MNEQEKIELAEKLYPSPKRNGNDVYHEGDRKEFEQEAFMAGLSHRDAEVSALREKVTALREAVANYMKSEGCSCCRDRDAHVEHTKKLAELLDVALYSDGSGYDFSIYQSR